MHQSIYSIVPVTFRLDLKDPFIFTAHHIDHFPEGHAELGPQYPAVNQEYRMYYGETVPGFPQHPHTGFETITLVEQGVIDHFDSLGNAGRYAAGDVQWLSTGNGVEHCEMFPLIHQDQANPLELFQIWFNSSSAQKQQDPDYKMLWREDIPHVYLNDAQGNVADIRVVAGQFNQTVALACPTHSWAASDENHVNIFLIQIAAHASVTIPATTATSTRFAYFYQGSELKLFDQSLQSKHLVELQPDVAVSLTAGDQEARILWLEGEPIGEPVAMRGPFVMNTQQELDEAFGRYRATQFGNWPWSSAAPTFKREQPRFSTYKGGERQEFPQES